MKLIETSNAPPRGAHYSQAVKANGFVFVGGQFPITPHGGSGMPSDCQAQARQVLRNIEAILKASDSSLGQVVSMTVYVNDLDNWYPVDLAFQEAFGDHRPARATVQTTETHYGAQVWMTAIAVHS